MVFPSQCFADAYKDSRILPAEAAKAVQYTNNDLAGSHQVSFPPPGLPIKSANDYQLVRRLGTGKFSDVFEAVDVNFERMCQKPKEVVDPRTLVVVKCLKPVTERKVRREILVLQHASTVPNVVRLLGIVLPMEYFAMNRGPTDLPKMPSLVLEHAGTTAQWLCHGQGLSSRAEDAAQGNVVDSYYLSDYEIRYYLFHLLVALDGLHSIGVMHRDVKPRNVLINRRGSTTQRPLVLIDLGLADFYAIHQRYNVRVASRHYKSPELLVGYSYYHYSLDMWGVGCILVGLLLRREPFFRGKDNVDQLAQIIAVLGTDDLKKYMQRYNVSITNDIQNIIKKSPAHRSSWTPFLPKDCPVPSNDAIDLLNQLLVYDHELRLTAKQAMQHKYFDPVRNRVLAEIMSYTYPGSHYT